MQTPKRVKVFQRYKGSDSKVLRFQLEKDSVTVVFSDHSAYRYTNQSAGPDNISKLKKLAVSGKGLGAFIESTLKDRFLQKVR